MSISSVDSEPLHVKSEVDLNLATEANRILYVLNKIISRARLAGLLRELLNEDGALLKNVVDPSSIFRLFQAYEKHYLSTLRTMTSLSKSSSTSRSSSKKSDITITKENEDDDSQDVLSSFESSQEDGYDDKKLKYYSNMTEVIYILEEYPEVQKLVESMENQLSPEMKFFITCLTEFRDRMEERLHENAAQYKTREMYMRETFEKNEKAKNKIEKLEEELLVTKTDANVCIIGRNILIKRHQNKIEQIQRNSQEAIERKVNESEKAMVNNWKSSMATQEVLKKDFLEASDKYSSSLRDHLAIEKVLRARRSKVENQVLGWIQKFDQDIGEKQAEEEEIQALLDKETKEVNEIQSKLDEQEEEYDELMQEKAQYEEEMLDRRLYQFIVNRSARRIQRSYRLYKARKLAKKLAKKGKKGKKKGKN